MNIVLFMGDDYESVLCIVSFSTAYRWSRENVF